MKTLSVVAASAALFAAFAPPSAFADGRPCPYSVPFPDVDIRSAEAKLVPDDVCVPDTIGVPQSLAYFNDYSWRAFIAMVWPAAQGKRGDPDPKQKLEAEQEGMPSGPPLVFETYKAEWETFPSRAAARPTDWSAPDDPNSSTTMWDDVKKRNCAPNGAKPGDFFLAPSSKFGRFENVRQAGLPATALVAQNGTLVRYLAAYNKKAYHYIFSRGLYLARNLPKDEEHALAFPTGSVTVKSSWIDLGKPGETPGAAHPETFHRRLAWLYDPFQTPPACEQHVVGLVGLHIVQKTAQNLSWIWSTFEHVKNAPDRKTRESLGSPARLGSPCPTPSSANSPYSFNDDSGTPMSLVPQAYLVGRWEKNLPHCAPPPVNVERLRPINQDAAEIVTRSTTETNQKWRDALRNENSVWQNYELVLTQWSTGGRCHDGCGVPEFTIPGRDLPYSDPTTAFNRLGNSPIANASMETWLPDKIEFGCMACHNQVASGKRPPNKDPRLDFVFSLRINAYPSRDARGSIAIRALDLLLEDAAAAMASSTGSGDPGPPR
jgi:hypothetical protein